MLSDHIDFLTKNLLYQAFFLHPSAGSLACIIWIFMNTNLVCLALIVQGVGLFSAFWSLAGPLKVSI